MGLNEKQQQLLRMLPGVDMILEQTRTASVCETVPKSVLIRSIREVLESFRAEILGGAGVTADRLSGDGVAEAVRKRVAGAMAFRLRRVVNATGVVVHTNLGRSLLADDALENIRAIAGHYSNLEFDLETGRRGLRYSSIEDILCEITGAEAAMAVNNNAGAVLLCLDTLARGKVAIVSRGELVEIGGSFRIPDVMARSGACMKEVGTTNRTHLRDYEGALDADTGLMLKVHTSNYSVVGFTASVSIRDLSALGEKHGIPVMEDLGSGTFIDLSKYGMAKDPTVQESVAAGADVITFSGDKLLGGPQAGIILGKKAVLDRIKKNPMTRALRIDKMTLAALESTLRLYRDPERAVREIPTLRMLTAPLPEIERKAFLMAERLRGLASERLFVTLTDVASRVGGGALPLQELPSKGVAVRIEGLSPNALERRMRAHLPPVIGRIEEDRFTMDFRTVDEDELDIIEAAFADMLQEDI
ncbi:L-seryl-tRNA(Sec) selenium transferase [Desulfonema ishimotonii]|uniref:L-seryl-tRNA(Sec) selenium transferase n=1 Tax=Desulfonema ishimotonii TaxID=45657 RepID=A0A401G1L6_9BACT|nr:L-seryl-tRNA(Sec) selenium transferase [Desulfonema ishimotonii]GBC63112.1 L-seryl-tRNA(Sec) selenium transferase [Desulfonema ishimotonii]